MSPELQQALYRKNCTHYRNGNMVLDAKTGTVVFDGSKGRQTSEGLGINAAKRYVTKNHLKSFTVK